MISAGFEVSVDNECNFLVPLHTMDAASLFTLSVVDSRPLGAAADVSTAET
jgi:hypothetical protein